MANTHLQTKNLHHKKQKRNKTRKETKIKMIIDQIQQYRKIREYGDHYLQNIIRIIFNEPIIDYRVISHKNLLSSDNFLPIFFEIKTKPKK
jgi:hypothetical protein